MNPVPTISVVLPVFNGERYLAECISSVLRQRLTDFELLIADDSSQDGSCRVIQKFQDSRLRIFLRERNLGLFRNLNLLLSDAQAPLVRFLCQDDALNPQCLQEEVDFFETHPNLGMSFCKAQVVDKDEKEIDRWALGDLPELVPSPLALQLFFYYGCICGNLSTVCIRREHLEEIGFFNDDYEVSGDYELWVRACLRRPLGVIHRHLIRLRSHSEQLSRAQASGIRFITENRKIRSTLLPLLPRDVHSRAKMYLFLRQNVLDTHHSIHCLLTGRVKHFLQASRTMGSRDFALGLLLWSLTLNNHLYRPIPKFRPSHRDLCSGNGDRG